MIREARSQAVLSTELVEDFETFQFIPWLKWLSAASGLSIDRCLEILWEGTGNSAEGAGFVTSFETRPEGSARYSRATSFIGWTPVEAAAFLFVFDHWRIGQAIPQRSINWNEEWGRKRAEMFISTSQYLDHLAKLKGPQR